MSGDESAGAKDHSAALEAGPGGDSPSSPAGSSPVTLQPLGKGRRREDAPTRVLLSATSKTGLANQADEYALAEPPLDVPSALSVRDMTRPASPAQPNAAKRSSAPRALPPADLPGPLNNKILLLALAVALLSITNVITAYKLYSRDGQGTAGSTVQAPESSAKPAPAVRPSVKRFQPAAQSVANVLARLSQTSHWKEILMMTSGYRAAFIGAAMAAGAWASPAMAQMTQPSLLPAGGAETVAELQNRVITLTAQVKALQASLIQCRNQIARLNRQEDAPPPKTTKSPLATRAAAVDDDAPPPGIATADPAPPRESVYSNDPGLMASNAAMEQYVRDLAPLKDKTLTDVQRSKLISDAAGRLGKAINRKISLTAVVQNVSVSTGNKATITTQSNTVRQMLSQAKLPVGAVGEMANPTFRVTLTEDQAASIRKGDEILVNAACAVSKNMTAGGTTNAQDTVVIGIQGGWHLILGDYTCKTGEISAKSLKPSSSKSAGRPVKKTNIGSD